MAHCLLHHTSALDDLRQEELASAEHVTNHIHAVHQRALDDVQGLGEPARRTKFLRVTHSELINALDKGVLDALLRRLVAPAGTLDTVALGSCHAQLAHSGGLALRLQRRGILQHALRRILASVEQHILHKLQQLLVQLLVLVLDHLGCVHNAHVHARRARMVQERAVEAPAHRLVAAEAEGNVGHAAADLRTRAYALDLTRRPDEVHSVVVVLRQASSHRENVGVKDDVLRIEAHVLHQDAVRALAH
mmetsp:Transcript_48080/g.121344  ORF Transcript_48080/g.121344 Transcript_48080/m.121344 type:complete len:248 (-) Transcript_48080:2167-2910(-)